MGFGSVFWVGFRFLLYLHFFFFGFSLGFVVGLLLGKQKLSVLSCRRYEERLHVPHSTKHAKGLHGFEYVLKLRTNTKGNRPSEVRWVSCRDTEYRV